jgi:NADH-quinone oxidoreductase subunit E
MVDRLISETLSIIKSYPADKQYALPMLQDIQAKFNFIPRESLEAAAEHLEIPAAQLYSMATFYKALSLTPKGKHIIKLCDGTACHLRGANSLIGGIARDIGVAPGETSADGEFSLELVNCLGSCAIAPVMVIDGRYYGKVTLEGLPEILKEYKEGRT